jgi:hypothetical protein
VPKTGSTSVRAILGKAWKPHLNLWRIKQLMETSWTEFGGRRNRIMAALYLLAPEERRRETAQAIRILFQVRICSQSMGPGCIAV